MMDVYYNQPPCDWNSPELTCHLSHAYTARHPAPASRSVCTLNKYNSALKYLMIVCLTPLLTYLFSTGQSQSITTCTTRSSPAHRADSVVWLLLPIQNVMPDVIDCFLTRQDRSESLSFPQNTRMTRMTRMTRTNREKVHSLLAAKTILVLAPRFCGGLQQPAGLEGPRRSCCTSSSMPTSNIQLPLNQPVFPGVMVVSKDTILGRGCSWPLLPPWSGRRRGTTTLPA